MRELGNAVRLAAAALALSVAPVIAADFTSSTLPPVGVFDPGLYDITAVTITQNTSATIIPGTSVSCNNGFPNFFHTDNSYWRRFDLNGAHGIVNPFTVTRVDFGVEEATAPPGAQPVTVRLYRIPNAAALILANLTLIGSFPTSVVNQGSTIFQLPVGPTVIANPLADDLVVEVFTPNGQAAGNRFFIGANNLGQTATAYISAADCGVTQPTPTGALGFPGSHLYMAVTGAENPVAAANQTWGRLKTLYR